MNILRTQGQQEGKPLFHSIIQPFTLSGKACKLYSSRYFSDTAIPYRQTYPIPLLIIICNRLVRQPEGLYTSEVFRQFFQNGSELLAVYRPALGGLLRC